MVRKASSLFTPNNFTAAPVIKTQFSRCPVQSHTTQVTNIHELSLVKSDCKHMCTRLALT